MNNPVQISASIVLFKEDIKTLEKTINCFLQISTSKRLFLIDNSPTNILEKYFKTPEVEYIFVGKNIGFGKAHNLVLNKIKNLSKYHLILNPDVVFKHEIIPTLTSELARDPKVSIISPKVIYPNGELQFTCRKTPTFLELLYRRLGIFKSYTRKKEYRNLDLNKPFFPEFVHGCFLLFNTEDFLNTQGFDERYFLYMEDADICRMQSRKGKKILYYPSTTIEHLHKRGSRRKVKLFLYHTISIFKYFKKWGF